MLSFKSSIWWIWWRQETLLNGVSPCLKLISHCTPRAIMPMVATQVLAQWHTHSQGSPTKYSYSYHKRSSSETCPWSTRYKDICDKTIIQQAGPISKRKWRELMRKKYSKLNRFGVWLKVKWLTIPKSRRCFKHKWVFEIKRNGIFRTWLGACGYSQ